MPSHRHFARLSLPWLGCVAALSAQVPTVRAPRMQSTPAAEARQISIYKADGSRQCQDGVGVSLSSMASELTAFGVAVTSQEKRHLPLAIPTECDRPTGAVNYFTIRLADLLKANIWRDTTTAFKVWDFDLTTMTVWIYDGLRECSVAPAISIDSTTHLLTNAGVLPITRQLGQRVLENRQCGELSGVRYYFAIPEGDYPAAYALGFRESPLPGKVADCSTVSQPTPGSSESLRLTRPEPLQMIIPRPDLVPKSLQGATVKVSFYTSAKGKVDSVRTSVPMPSEMITALSQYAFRPSTFKGCPVPGVAVISMAFGGGQ